VYVLKNILIIFTQFLQREKLLSELLQKATLISGFLFA